MSSPGEQEPESGTNADFARWDTLLEEQSNIHVSKNAALEARVEELERELSVWKGALITAEAEEKTLKRTVTLLERNIDSMKDDNPLLLCLIDGDGSIFTQNLWCLGQAGGRQAALLLTKGITDHVAGFDETLSARSQLWLSMYCNKRGLMETLVKNSVCSAEQFEAFVVGLNQASPLFSVVDVGSGKEAADSKIKECLRVFSRFPQVSRVYFGGTHDNGYTSTLNLLENEGLLSKVVLLRGYSKLANELQALDIPYLDIDGLFMTQKLQTNFVSKLTHTHTLTSRSATPPTDAQDTERLRTAHSNAKEPLKGARTLDPSLAIHQHTPPPCTFYYLAKCKQGPRCRYGHDYWLSPQNILEMRLNIKKTPCSIANKDRPCPDGDACILGHYCPKGPKCPQQKANRCKFVGKDMHLDLPFLGVRARSASSGTDRRSDVAEPAPSTPRFSPLGSPVVFGPAAQLVDDGAGPRYGRRASGDAG